MKTSEQKILDHWTSDDIIADCPQCKAHAIVALTERLLALQTDGTTRVCHLGFGGCNTGFAWEVEWTSGPVDRSGLAEYTHLIRANGDPERKPRPKGGQKDKAPHLTFNKQPAAHWQKIIVEHLADGVPRTFNRIGVELWDKTADVLFTTTVNDALWAAVEAGEIEHTLQAPILFRRKK